MLAWLCKVFGHGSLTRSYFKLSEGGVMVVKCERCGYVHTTEIPQAVENRIVELFR
jgi:uncharacterized Zn finger protein